MSDPDIPSPSATVVLVRPGSIEPEIFMVQRHARSSFGSAYAFPGGVVDPADSDVHRFCRGFDDPGASHRLGVQSGGLSFYSAAIRELFEETGVLLADIGCIDEDISSVRGGLNDGSISWADFVMTNELQLYSDALHYISHWITPEQRPRRYSTRFFLTQMPAGQSALHCGGELTESCWSTANEMLAAARRGDAVLHFPTVKTLESVARHKSFAELMSWAESSVDWGVTTMLPAIIKRDGRDTIVLPGELDYPGMLP